MYSPSKFKIHVLLPSKFNFYPIASAESFDQCMRVYPHPSIGYPILAARHSVQHLLTLHTILVFMAKYVVSR